MVPAFAVHVMFRWSVAVHWGGSEVVGGSVGVCVDVGVDVCVVVVVVEFAVGFAVVVDV